MQRTVKDELLTVHYDSVDEMFSDLRDPALYKSSKRDISKEGGDDNQKRPDWYSFQGFDEMEHVLDSEIDYFPKELEQATSDFDIAEFSNLTQRQRKRDYAGNYIVMPAAAAGAPRAFENRRNASTPSVTILLDATAWFQLRPDDFKARAIAYAAVMEALSASGKIKFDVVLGGKSERAGNGQFKDENINDLIMTLQVGGGTAAINSRRMMRMLDRVFYRGCYFYTQDRYFNYVDGCRGSCKEFEVSDFNGEAIVISTIVGESKKNEIISYVSRRLGKSSVGSNEAFALYGLAMCFKNADKDHLDDAVKRDVKVALELYARALPSIRRDGLGDEVAEYLREAK